jgi:hypothetical protein
MKRSLTTLGIGIAVLIGVGALFSLWMVHEIASISPEQHISGPSNEIVQRMFSDVCFGLPVISNAIHASKGEWLTGNTLELVVPYDSTTVDNLRKAMGFTNAFICSVQIPSRQDKNYPWHFTIDTTDGSANSNVVVLRGIQPYN